MLKEAIKYYTGTKLQGNDLRRDIIRNFPTEIHNIDIIIRNVK